jgi:hypothetical protein
VVFIASYIIGFGLRPYSVRLIGFLNRFGLTAHSKFPVQYIYKLTGADNFSFDFVSHHKSGGSSKNIPGRCGGHVPLYRYTIAYLYVSNYGLYALICKIRQIYAFF